MINIKGLNKIEVLDALYQGSHPQGMGMLHYVPGGLTEAEKDLFRTQLTAQGILGYFDYLNGRVLKINIDGDEFDERLYDRDCGNGAAMRVIRNLLRKVVGE